MRKIIIISTLSLFLVFLIVWQVQNRVEVINSTADSPLVEDVTDYLEKPLTDEDRQREIPGIYMASVCRSTGCNNHICSDQAVSTTCDWLEEYACYAGAVCERLSNGQCGWRDAEAVQLCVEEQVRSSDSAEGDRSDIDDLMDLDEGGGVFVESVSGDSVRDDRVPVGCSVYYDGCNTCDVSAHDQSLESCTEIECVRFEEPRCVQFAIETSASSE